MGQLAVARRGPGRPRTRPGRVLGDKAYSSAAIRAHLRRRGIKATIAEPADQARNRHQRGSAGGRPPGFDPIAYKQRNTVERAIGRLRQHRAVATRYDKRDFVWRGTIDVASIRIWLRNPPQDLQDTLWTATVPAGSSALWPAGPGSTSASGRTRYGTPSSPRRWTRGSVAGCAGGRIAC
jgi:transposase